MTPRTLHRARTIAATLVTALLAAACSSRMHGTQGELPARPALGARIDRAGRPLTANALIGPFAADDVSDRRKEAYNRAAPADWPQFAADLQSTLGIYDGLDRTCGNHRAPRAMQRPPSGTTPSRRCSPTIGCGSGARQPCARDISRSSSTPPTGSAGPTGLAELRHRAATAAAGLLSTMRTTYSDRC
jgi:hypothetical protein